MALDDEENLDEEPGDEEDLEEEPSEPPIGQSIEDWQERIKKYREQRKKQSAAKKARMAQRKPAGQTAEKAVEKGAEAGIKGGIKAGTGAAATAAAPETAGLSLAAKLAIDFAVDAIWKYGKYLVMIIVIFISLIIFLILLMYFFIGNAGRLGTDPLINLDPRARANYHDVLADLASAGSPEAKQKLLISKGAEIHNRLTSEKSGMQAIKETPDVKRSIELIDKMWPLMLRIRNLGERIKNNKADNQKTKIEVEKQNTKWKEEIDKIYDEWHPLWEEFEKVFPGFQGPKYVDDYVNFLKKYGINAVITDRFYAPRPKPRVYHNGYDFAYPDGSPVITGWNGTISRIEPWGGDEWCVYVLHDGYEIGYGHIYVANGIKPGVAVEKGDVLGTIASGAGHVDIKIFYGDKYVDWDKDPVY